MTTNQMLKQAAVALEKVRDENRKLAEEKAAMAEELTSLKRKDESLKLALKIAEKDGLTDYKDFLAKAQEINDSGMDLEVISAGIKFAGAKDFSLGKVATEHPSQGGGTPESEFIAYLMSED